MSQRILTILVLAPLLFIAVTHVKANVQPPCSAWVEPHQDLQQAIDTLRSDTHPAVLCLNKGEYRVDKLLHIGRDGVHLRGTGTDTVIRLKKDVQQPLIVIGDYQNQQPAKQIQNVVIERIRLIGATDVKHEFMPERPYLSNSVVVLRAANNVSLLDLKVSQCRSACLLSEYDSQTLNIERNDVSGATWDGVSFNRTAHVRLIDNVIHNNVAAGITTEHLEDSEIRGNRLEHNGSQGLYLADSRRNVFTGNRFISNKAAGVFLTCSIRYRTPEVLCWDNSMSQENVFEHNIFQSSPYTYTIGVDHAANCKASDFKPNVWRNNKADTLGFNPPSDVYGTCVQTH
ncbi:MAG TPA: right-handed parallel beta-helix repeat-containing protein [Xylella sp.]